MTWYPKQYSDALRKRLERLLKEHIDQGGSKGQFSVKILHLDKEDLRKDGGTTYGTSLLGRLLSGQKRYWTIELIHRIAELSGGISIAELLTRIERDDLPPK